MTADRLTVAIATPLRAENVALLRELEPRLDVRYEPELSGDEDGGGLTGVPERTSDQQAAYERMLDGAEAFFGVPDQSGRALARAVRANPGLRWAHTIPAGGGQQVRAARLDEAELARVVFTTSAGVHAGPLAEFAVFGVLAGLKELPRLTADRAAGVWGERRAFRQLDGATVAVVGLGSIGRRTAELLALFGARVIGIHRRDVDAPGVAEIRPPADLASVAAAVDAVVLALPGTAETDRMLSADVLAGIRPGATVVNVGRGTTIDEGALAAALGDGRVALAVLDVTYTEPLPAESPLWQLDNVVLSPHTATTNPGEPRRIVELFADNARRLLDGEPLRNVVNTVEFY